MNPAFSVILFTTLSGAGYGLLAWLGAIIFYWRLKPFADDPTALQWLILLLLVPLSIGMVLTAVGLISSMFHLGKPSRAWRAFSQWRTSWLSREGVLAMLTYVPALALLALLTTAFLRGVAAFPPGSLVSWLGGVLTLLSLLTVSCTAMIYASLKPVPAWQHRMVVPVYIAFALLTGLTLLMAITMTLPITAENDMHLVIHRMTLFMTAGLAVALAVMKLAYWRDIDRIELPSREAATALEGIGTVTTFERPHTDANYLTREMGFVLARKHSRKLRLIALLLFAGIPLLALLVAALLPATGPVTMWVAAVAALAGAFVERWLFFAEAKHTVMLYY